MREKQGGEFKSRKREKNYLYVPNLYGRDNEYHIEGGDTFNGNETTLLIGISQRTQYEAIKVLAKKLFFGENENKIEVKIVITLGRKKKIVNAEEVI